MAKSLQIFNILFYFGILLSLTTALPTSVDEDRYLDKEYNRELINWLNAAQYPQQFYHPCRYYNGLGNNLGNPMSKRNSELINSLLSLPKSMNDAGK